MDTGTRIPTKTTIPSAVTDDVVSSPSPTTVIRVQNDKERGRASPQATSSLVDAETFQRDLYPARNLPNDILRQIVLEWCHLESKNELRGRFVDCLNTSQPHWRCAQVSRSWRQAAFSCTHLWTSIGIQIPAVTAPESKKIAMVHNLTSLLRWTGSLPLAVEVRSYHHFNPDHRLFSVIRSHSSRWKTLRLSFYFAFSGIDKWESIILSMNGRVPLLRSLHLDFQSRRPRFVLEAFNAPNLTEVIVDGVDDSLHFTINIPWNQITVFGAHSGIVHLHKMSSLVHYYDANFVCPTGPQIDLSHMESMVLVCQWPFRVVDLERLQMSDRFTELHLYKTETNPDGSLESLAPFLLRWGSSLQTLCLDSTTIAEPLLVRVLEHLKSLRSLTLNYRQTAKSNLLLALANTQFLPQLYKLSLLGFPLFRGAEIVGVLSARLLHNRGTLRKLGIPSGYVKIFDKDLDRFRACGLQIKGTGDKGTESGCTEITQYYQRILVGCDSVNRDDDWSSRLNVYLATRIY
ncbi:hypothetical protein VNI00_003035 [Paramarasmius palmivorus]|uniref:F-box domain-containing protein n=1 Tax=Paramarasmius palmivorus TaxID=297713 RepID=A0AAW0E118_9AGAR